MNSRYRVSLVFLFMGALILRILNILPFVYKPILLVYAVFIPGALILSSKYFTKNLTRFVIYSVAVSIIVDYLLMLALNFVLPLFDISRPLRKKYVLLGFSIVVLIIILYSTIRDRNPIQKPWKLPISVVQLSSILGGISIILLSITGVLILNQYHTPIVLYLFLIEITVVVIMFRKIPTQLYPFMIFSISLAMLYHTSLVSDYLWGRDIFNEFFIFRIVYDLDRWIPNYIVDPLNTTLSITLLPIFFKYLLNLGLITPFKVIYPLFLSLGMVALYEWYHEAFEEHTSLFSILIIVFSITFYAEIPQMARVMVGEFFLGVTLLSMAEGRRFLSLLFAGAVLVSHYSTFYLLLFELTVANILIGATSWNLLGSRVKFLSLLTLLLLPISFLWFLLTSKAIVFRIVTVYLFMFIKEFASILSYQVLPATSPQHILSMDYPLLVKLTQYLYLILAVFMATGVGFKTVGLLKNQKKRGFNEMIFYMFGIVNMLFLAILFLIPVVSRTITTTRVYHIILLFSSPFAVIGFQRIISKLGWRRDLHGVMAAFIIAFLILNSGVLASLTKSVYDDTSIAFQYNADWPKFNEGDVYAAKWVSAHWNVTKVRTLYGDVYGWVLPGGFKWPYCSQLPSNPNKIKYSSYIFFRTWNIRTRTILMGGGRLTGGRYCPVSILRGYLNDLIYNDDKSEVFLTKHVNG